MRTATVTALVLVSALAFPLPSAGQGTYPVCPGVNWNTGKPLVVTLAPPTGTQAISRTESFQQFLNDQRPPAPEEEPITVRSVDRSDPVASSKHPAKELEKIVAQHPNDKGVSEAWHSATSALRLISENDRDAVVRTVAIDAGAIQNAEIASINRPPMVAALAPSATSPPARTASTTELQDQINMSRVLATAIAVHQNFDPAIYSAHFPKKPAELNPQDLLALSTDKSIVALAAITPKVTSGATAVIVTGEPGPPGASHALPATNFPVALNQSDPAHPCFRVATAADMKLDPATNHTNRYWEPNGFRDVGAMVTYAPGTAAPWSICTVTRMSSTHILTAMHCVIDSKRGEAVVKHDFTAAGTRTLFLFPKLDGTPLNIALCFQAPSNCGFFVATPAAPATLADKATWPSSSAAPIPDVALVAAAFDPAMPAPTTRLASKLVSPERITLAGFGFSDLNPSSPGWGVPLVSWQQSTTTIDKLDLQWSADRSSGQGGVCHGDSGGPVYDGDIAGLNGEIRIIGGVTSSGAIDNTSTALCPYSGGETAARVDTELIWICRATHNGAMGCPGNPGPAAAH